MYDPTDPRPKINFNCGNLPADTQTFYNTKAFAANEIEFLTTMVSEYDQAIKNGLQAIKSAINGLT